MEAVLLCQVVRRVTSRVSDAQDVDFASLIVDGIKDHIGIMRDHKLTNVFDFA